MDDGIKGDWLDVAMAMYQGWTRYGDEVAGRRLRGLLPRVVAALDASHGRWDATVSAGLAAAWVRPLRDHMGDRAQHAHEVEVRCLRTAWAIASGNLADVPRGERGRVIAFLEGNVSRLDRWLFDDLPPPPAVARPVAGSVSLPFVLARPASATSRAYVAVSGHVVVAEVAGEDAPVVATLLGEEGGEVRLRVVDGRCLRPVLAPNSWEPATLDRFAEAAASGEAWADNPWVPAAVAAERGLAVADVARPRGRMTRADAAADEAFVAAAHARAGALVLMDGIVHRPCDPPTVAVGVLRRMQSNPLHPGLRMGWDVGNLNQFSRQETLGPLGPVVDRDGGAGFFPFPAYRPDIPVGDAASAEALVVSLRDRAEVIGKRHLVQHALRPPKARVHDAALLPDPFEIGLGRLVAWGRGAAIGPMAALAALAVHLDPAERRPDPDLIEEAREAAAGLVARDGPDGDAQGTGAMVLLGLDVLAAQARRRSEAVPEMNDGIASFTI